MPLKEPTRDQKGCGPAFHRWRLVRSPNKKGIKTMAKRPNPSNAKIRDLRAQVRDLNAALTDCMQHKVDLEVELHDLHGRHDRAHETIENMKEHIGLLGRQAQDAERHIERQAGEISTLKRTVRTVAAFAAREPGVDVRSSHYGRSHAVTGANRLLHAGDGYGATETL